MKRPLFALVAVGVALIPILNAAPAAAQTGSNPSTFVSGKGADSGTCVITAPCLTLTFALTQTQAGGDVYVVDEWVSLSENVTITGAVAVHGGSGNHVLGAASGNAVTINAGSGDTVNFTGIGITTLGGAVNGIVFNSGNHLTLQNSNVTSFSNIGIVFSPTTSGSSSKLDISDGSRLTGNKNGDILIRPLGSTGAHVQIRDSKIHGSSNAFGFKIDTTGGTGVVTAEIANSAFYDLSTNGVIVLAPSVSGHVSIYQTNIHHVTDFGVVADGAAAQILLDNSTINFTGTGVGSISGGIVASYGNNGINFNTSNNTGILTAQSLH
jgi:hypothetical protein